MVEAFLQKKLQVKFVNNFCKKAPPNTFDWILNTTLDDTIKKSIHFKDISQVI